jgi:hypothetical protein
LKKGSLGWKFKGLVPFLIVESDWRATNPPHTPTISPNTNNQNIGVAILFNVVESSRNQVFEDDNHTKPLRSKVVSYALGHKL